MYYCMGGLEILANATVVATNGKDIMGLYAAGEVAGGVKDVNERVDVFGALNGCLHSM